MGYDDKVEKVTISNRVTETPVVFVTSQYGYSANMERIMKNQAFADRDRQSYLVSRKTMEVNPRHPIVSELAKRAMDDPDSMMCATWPGFSTTPPSCSRPLTWTASTSSQRSRCRKTKTKTTLTTMKTTPSRRTLSSRISRRSRTTATIPPRTTSDCCE